MFWYLLKLTTAQAPNIGAQLAFRFLAGLFGATPLVCAGGSISDMWTASERTAVFPVFANAAFWGPILGPVLGGFIGQAASNGIISWRWTEWVCIPDSL
jgi:MFS family permease